MPVKETKTPGKALNEKIEEYQITAFSLSKNVEIDYHTILNILKGKGRITIQSALKLSKYFGQPTSYWLDIQLAADIAELSQNKKYTASLNKISKVQKPKTPAKAKTMGKTAKRSALSEKRKTAAKVPGAKPANGKRP
ncbi:MAG: HigA family addiction module antitoxin [Treponema sp.]|nr:HigA family addiction module antitoxin [Treponema sp.]